MKKITLLIIILVQSILISCNKKSEKKSNSEKIIVEKSITKEIKSVKNESKFDKNKIRKYAESILENEIYPSDNNETFEFIKKMYTKNKNDLEFYFKVFRVIIEKSDGALSEAIGIEIMNFLKHNPDFFIEQYSDFKMKEQQKFIGFIAYEFYFAEPEHNEEIDFFFSEKNIIFEQNTEPKRRYLNSIKELTKIATEKMINE